MAEEKYYRRDELLERYIIKMLYEWNNGKFEKEYLRKLERNQAKWKGRMVGKANGYSGSKNLEGKVISELQTLDSTFF